MGILSYSSYNLILNKNTYLCNKRRDGRIVEVSLAPLCVDGFVKLATTEKTAKTHALLMVWIVNHLVWMRINSIFLNACSLHCVSPVKRDKLKKHFLSSLRKVKQKK